MPASLEHKQRILAHLEQQQPAADIGKLPWRVMTGGDHFDKAFIRDGNGNYICRVPKIIAHLIVNAVNDRSKLLGDNVNYRDVLLSLFQQVYAMAQSQGRTHALDLIEKTLHPKDDLQ